MTNITLLSRLRALDKEQNNARLALLSGVSRATIIKLKKDNATLNHTPAETIYKLAAALNCKPHDLWSPVEIVGAESEGGHGQ